MGQGAVLKMDFHVKGFWMTLATLLRPRIWFRHEAPWMRLCARAILAGWLLPLVFALFVSFSSVPAHAQDQPAQTVVVLDFATSNGIDPLLGRKAADALAVELNRTGLYKVVARQDLQKAVGEQAGLQPPFNDTAQQRLAEAVGASSVFSGQITGLQVTPNQSAQVRILVRQLDAVTGDYINGTQNIEPTEQKLTPIANEVLVDEAINKVAFAAVRSMRQTTLPFGSVLNTTRYDMELSIGTRNGVSVGQRYTVLRDVFNAGRNVTERVKTGEVTITSVEADQATAKVTTGGAAGVRTGDYVRQIFEAPRSPALLSRTSGGGSSTPVTAPPVNYGNRHSIANGSAGRGLIGALGLGFLLAFVGFGGGGSNSSPGVGNPVELNPADLYPHPTITFNNGFNGIAKGLQGESVVGYIVYRGTAANFAASADNIQGFIDARNSSSGSRMSFSEPIITTGRTSGLTRTVLIQPDNGSGTIGGTTGTTGGTTGNGTGTGTGSSIAITITNTSASGAIVLNNFQETQGAIQFTYTQQPLQIGQQYFYRVQRISAERVSTIGGGNNNNGNNNGNNNNGNNNNGNNNGTNTGTTTNLLPFRSPSSSPTGGYTPLLRPIVVPNAINTTTGTAYDLANLTVTLNATSDINQLISTGAAFTNTFLFGFNNGYYVPLGTNATTGADTVQIQISTTPNFSSGATFVSQDFPAQSADAAGGVTFAFPNGIVLPTGANFTLGTSQLYLRAQSRNSTDAVPTFRISPTIVIPASQVTDSRNATIGAVVSRFVNTSASANGIRIGPNRGLNGRLTAGGMARSNVGRPR